MARPAAIVPDSDGAGRFLPWVVAVMLFLAVLACAGALALNGAIANWNSQLTGTMTVEIPDTGSGIRSAQIRRAVAALKGTAGVEKVRVLSRAEMVALLEPWLGRGQVGGDLPLPVLIDVTLARKYPADIAFIEKRLRAAVPTAMVDDHKLWLSKVTGLARAAQWLAAGIIVAILLAMSLVIIFAARASLSSNKGVVEVLHMIGAHDGFVARHFQNHAFRMALKGGFGGFIAAVLTMSALVYWGAGASGAMLAGLGLGPVDMMALLSLPFLAAGIAALTARLAVLLALRKYP